MYRDQVEASMSTRTGTGQGWAIGGVSSFDESLTGSPPENFLTLRFSIDM